MGTNTLDRKGRPREPFRTRLCLAAAAVMAFVIVVPCWSLSEWIASERARRDDRLARAQAHIGAEIERELGSTLATLKILASSPSLQNGALEEFHRRASEISRLLNVQISLHDLSHESLVYSTGIPWESLPRKVVPPSQRREAELQMIRTGEVAVSNVFLAPIAGQYIVSMLMPVRVGGQIAYALSIAIPARAIAGILENAALAPGQVALVADRDSTIIARSVNHDKFVGTKVPPAFRGEGPKEWGLWSGANLDGMDFHAFYRRLASTNWIVVLGEPQSAFNGTGPNIWAAYAGISTLLFFGGLALANGIGRRLDEDLGLVGIDRDPTPAEFSLLLDSSPNGIVLVEPSGRILLLNTTAARLFGYAKHELIGQSVETLVPDRLRQTHFDLHQAYARQPTERAMASRPRPIHVRRRDGSEFPAEIGLSPVRIGVNRLTMATVVDVSARLGAEAALATARAQRDRLRFQLLQTSENERRRLAHELHDQAGQSLTALTLRLQLLEAHLDRDGRARLPALCALVDNISKELHWTVWNLRPPSLAELGLVAALEGLVGEWSETTGIRAVFHCEGKAFDVLSDDLQSTIYRIVQEALANVVKHARSATKVEVTLAAASSALQILIEDNGIGFDTNATRPPDSEGGLGLLGIQERLDHYGGKLSVESNPGEGTTLVIRIPVEQQTAVA